MCLPVGDDAGELPIERINALWMEANAPMHGKTSTISHDGQGVFAGIATPLTVAAAGPAAAAPVRERRGGAGRVVLVVPLGNVDPGLVEVVRTALAARVDALDPAVLRLIEEAFASPAPPPCRSARALASSPARYFASAIWAISTT